ncbi:MAG: diguanylate cyclase, partial [Pseudomonadota bacterium]
MPPPQEPPQRLSYSAVLGLTGGSDSEWAKLRGMQYSALADVTFLRVFAHAILAVFVAQVYLNSVPIILMGAWIAMLVGLHFVGARLDRKLADVERRKMTRKEFYQQAVISIASALLWGAAVFVFGPMGSLSDLTALILVIAIIASGAVYFRTMPPFGAVLYAFVTGGLIATYLGFGHLWFAMTGYIAFTITTVIGALQGGQTYLEARLSQTAIAEKEEVVSLLLREFEENEADWLWEVDPQRRLRSVSPRFAYALGATQKEVEGKALIECITGRSWDEGQFPGSLHELADRLKNRQNFSNLLVQVSIKGEARWWEL